MTKLIKAYEAIANAKKYTDSEFELTTGMLMSSGGSCAFAIGQKRIYIKDGKLSVDEYYNLSFNADTELTEIAKNWMPKKPENNSCWYYYVDEFGEICKAQYPNDESDLYLLKYYNCFPSSIYTKQQLIDDHVTSMSKAQRIKYLYATQHDCFDKNSSWKVSYDACTRTWEIYECLTEYGTPVSSFRDVWFKDEESAQQCADMLNEKNINAWGEVKDG